MKQNMFRTVYTCVLALVFVAGAVRGGAPDKISADPSLLLWLPMDKGYGNFAVDLSKNMQDADLSNVRWATGAFGKAVHFNGTNSFMHVQVPGLNGATQFTVAVWSQWDDNEPRRYPNLFTSPNWSPGGMMMFMSGGVCSFRLGRPGHRAGAPGHEWREQSLTLLPKIPVGKWTHLCVTFNLPELTAYVDGVQVSRTSWPYPVEVNALRLGGWADAVCHRGLLDDLRIYSRALSGAEVKELSSDPKRADPQYAIVDESEVQYEVAARFANRHAELVFDTEGQVVSLLLKRRKRELLTTPHTFVYAQFADGRRASARSLRRKGDLLEFGFPHGSGVCTIKVTTNRDFFEFALNDLTLADVTSLTFCSLPVNLDKYHGAMANMLSDDADAVCLRGYELPLEMSARDQTLRVWSTSEYGLTGGWRAGLAAGPKDEMPAMLQKMAVSAGVPLSRCAGPWSLEADPVRGSYLFADLAYAATDDWIEIARRGGFSTLHLHGWWQSLGHYNVRTNYYPRGLDDMRDAAARIQAAGLRVGIHTLTACIQPSDPWITPVPSPHLIPFDTYTLARDFSPTDTVLYVKEQPSARHDTVFTYSGNGNAIRIDKEIIQYSEISREPPYAFKACKRGAFRTKPSAHATGDQADYLQQRYISFYPQPDSPLADELADCIARVFNTCKLDQLYFDGSEGMRSRYGIDVMRHKIMRRLQGDPVIEASCYGAHNWWFHSRLGTWDHPVWGAKLFHDDHVAVCERYRHTDLLAPQMGWWAPRMAVSFARGHYLDEIEYFACKNLALDAAMSIQGVNVNRAPLPYHLERQFTLLGWYECLRLARYFDDATVARLYGRGTEFRLRQTADGEWRFTPVAMRTHRVTGPDDGSSAWQVDNQDSSQPLCLRAEALYAAAPADSPAAKPLVTADEFKLFKTATASSAVRLSLAEVTEDTRGGARNLRLKAENSGTKSSGAWARAVLSFPAPYRDITGTGAFGLWIKGDGSGALLNIQLGCPREFSGALSDHYVTLDFNGWRYVELLMRERDSARLDEHVWPYRRYGAHSLFRTPLNMAHISQVSFYLNDLHPGGGATVTLSPVQVVPTVPVKLERPVLTVNGCALTVPFTLASGEFAELEPDGVFTHYSEKGDPLARVVYAEGQQPEIRSGANMFAFAGGRAEISINTFGTPFGTRRSQWQIDWGRLEREYEMPRLIDPESGLASNRWTVAVRPRSKARLEVELKGEIENPVLTIGGYAACFPVTLKAQDRLLCRDGKTWQVYDASRAKLAEGVLDKALPLLRGGSTEIDFTCRATGQAQVKLVKVYR
jgi:hypothetical protein